MTRYDVSPMGWKDQNAIAPLEVEAEIFRNGEFSLRIVTSAEDRPGESRDDCERRAAQVADFIGPALLAVLRARGCFTEVNER